MDPRAARPSARVRVGSFELDLQSGELRQAGGGEKVILREQPFQVLQMLIQRDGKIVTRSEIKEKLWPNDTIVDFDHSINVAIGILRRALGDSAGSPRYIETLARRGYRLLAAVEWLESGAPPASPADPGQGSGPGDWTGRKVGQYRVLEVLGGGGMGMVYKAEDLKLGRHVALKFLPVDLAGDTIALHRLQREAQTASALNHPNICTIYDIEEYEGQSFIAMELLEGDTLQERLAASAPSPLPLATLIDIAIQICVGLQAAHSKAIVHRDIKPGNIFLTTQGTVKLLDFGVAKFVPAEEPVGTASIEHCVAAQGHGVPPGLTVPGAAVGTAGYMSPEQVRREALDGRSDLFSLGVVLYEMATGKRAFRGEAAVTVQAPILTTTPAALEAVNPEVPRALALVVAGALESDRQLRFQTAAEMRRALERVRADLEQPPARRARRWLPAVAAIVMIASVVVWFAWRRGSQVTLAENDTIVLADVANATSDRVYGEALTTALRVSLEQTPYLNVLAEPKIRAMLGEIGVAADAALSEAVVLQLCRHTGSKVVVAASIADAGNRLRVELKGIDCLSGATASVIRREASRNEVVAALGSAALQLRTDLGEPATSLASHNVALEEATSSSPDALELLTLGYRRQLASDHPDAISYYQRAVQTDPNLALAHAALSNAYGNLGVTRAAAASGRAAFALRDRMTAPTRFDVESTYHRLVNGDWEASCAVLTRYAQTFPHDIFARNNLALCLSNVGEVDRALGEAREAARLLPAPFTYTLWIWRSMDAERPDEAQAALDEGRARGFDSIWLRDLQAELAFLRNDDAAMQEQWAWAAGKAEAFPLIMGKAMVETSRGQFQAALRTVEIASSAAASLKVAPRYAMEMTQMRATVGLPWSSQAAVPTSSLLGSRLVGALVAARVGRIEGARQSANALRQEFPLDTSVQKYGLPLIEATLRLQQNDPAGAVAALKPASKYDLAYFDGVFPRLYASYVRGMAYLQLEEFAAAAGEFQRLLAHPGMVRRWVYGPLARLHLARAQRGLGNLPAARSSYEAFLHLWRNADADIPLYRDAQAEYNELRDQR